MTGSPAKEGSKPKSFAIYEETWLMLKELEYLYVQRTKKNKSLKKIAYEAIEEYFDKRKNKIKEEKKK